MKEEDNNEVQLSNLDFSQKENNDKSNSIAKMDIQFKKEIADLANDNDI